LAKAFIIFIKKENIIYRNAQSPRNAFAKIIHLFYLSRVFLKLIKKTPKNIWAFLKLNLNLKKIIGGNLKLQKKPPTWNLCKCKDIFFFPNARKKSLDLIEKF
jgi:hypothetical protein